MLLGTQDDSKHRTITKRTKKTKQNKTTKQNKKKTKQNKNKNQQLTWISEVFALTLFDYKGFFTLL